MNDYTKRLADIWDINTGSYTSTHKLYALDELICLQMDVSLNLSRNPKFGWFYVLMIMIYEGYSQAGLLDEIDPNLLQELLLHHCYRYKTEVITKPDHEANLRQTKKYVTLRKNLRDGISAVLYRPRPSAE
jgi:hypothetical protein